MPYFLNEFSQLSAYKVGLLITQFNFLKEDRDLLIKEFAPNPILNEALAVLSPTGSFWARCISRCRALYNISYTRELHTLNSLPPMSEIQEFVALRSLFNDAKEDLDTLRVRLEMSEGPNGHKYSHAQFAHIGYGNSGMNAYDERCLDELLYSVFLPPISSQSESRSSNLPDIDKHSMLGKDDVAQRKP